MIWRQCARAILSMLACAWLAACASPREHLYSLEDPTREFSVGASVRATVVLGPVSVPELVDRPQLVVRDGIYNIVAREQERWATPLKEALPRLLASELTRRVEDRRFVTSSSAVINTPSAHLLIDITQLDMARTEGVHVIAHWVYRPVARDTADIEGDVAAHSAVSMAGYAGYVDALERAGIAIADDIAVRLESK